MKRKNEYKLGIGALTTALGNAVYDVTCNIVLSHFSGRTSLYTAIYQSSEIIVGILVNLFGGVFSDRASDKRKILVVTDLFCGLACFALAFFTDSSYLISAIIIVNIILALLSSFNSPAVSSIVKFALDEDRISRYNSIIRGMKEVVRVIAPVISIFLLEVLGFRVVVLVNAATFLVSALFEMYLHIPKVEKEKIKTGIWKDMKEGLAFIVHSKVLFLLIVFAALVNFFFAGFGLFLPYTKNFFKESLINPYAIFKSTAAIGGIVAAIFAYILKKQKAKRMIIYIALCGLAILLLYLAIQMKILILGAIAAFGYSFFLSCFNITFMTNVQINTPEEYIGRVFSVIYTLICIFMPIGSFLFSALFTTDNAISYLVIGLGITVVSLITLVFQQRVEKGS
ncbi:MAG: MFS transporter [Eubacteriales bacterium]|nr:MFS transporter [Eubacteriales bacterium]